MQAIRTRYHGPTDSKGSRIIAKCEAGSIQMPYNHALNLEANHAAAAQQLAERFSWAGVYHGGSFGGDYYWVCESGWPPTVKVANTQEAA